MQQFRSITSSALKEPQKTTSSVYTPTQPTQQQPRESLFGAFSKGVGTLYHAFSEAPGIKQASNVVGDIVGLAGYIEGGLVGGIGQAAVESYKGLTGQGFDAGNIAKKAEETAKATAEFGKEAGTAAVPAAATGGFGKGVQIVLGVSMAYDGQKNIREGMQSGNYEQVGEGLIQFVPAFLSLKSSTGSLLGDVKAGFTPKVPGETVGIMQGVKGSLGEIKKDFLLSPEFKNQVSKEYRFLRYGENAPVLGASEIKLLNSAIKPSDSKIKSSSWNTNLGVTMDEVSGKNVTDIVSLDTAIKDRKAEIWSDVTSALNEGDKNNLMIDGDAIASAIRERKNDPRLQIENVKYVRDTATGEMKRVEFGSLADLERLASAYEGKKIGFLQAEAVLEAKNAEEQAYYKKNMTSRNIAEKADPVLAANLDIARQIREQQDAILETIDINGFSGLKKRYGALKSVGEEVQARMFKDSKLQTSSLAQKIATGRQAASAVYGIATGNPAPVFAGIADKVFTDYIRSLDEASSKINRVFETIKRNKKINQMPSLIEGAKDFKIGLGVQDISKLPGNAGLPNTNAQEINNKVDHTKATIEATKESTNSQAVLLAEAKKYKTAEEFVRSLKRNPNIVWHETATRNAREIINNGFKTGKELNIGEAVDSIHFSVGRNTQGASYIRDGSKGVKLAADISNLNLLDLSKVKKVDGLPSYEQESFIIRKNAEKNGIFPDGYDGMYLSSNGKPYEYILRKDVANDVLIGDQTQLLDIYKKAHGK